MAPRKRPKSGTDSRARGTTAIVLAAGSSSRMGRPKALVTVGGKRMLERTLASLAAAEITDVVVVLGYRAAEVRRTVGLGSATVVENPGYAEGMASSLRAGVAAVDGRSERVLIVLADQPFVTPETLRHLLRHGNEGDGRIFIPTYKGVWGNPVLFDTRLAGEVTKIHGDVGCRAMFPDHTAEIREVPVDDPGILVDIDTESELRALEGAMSSGGSLHDALDRLAEPRWSLHTAPGDRPVPKSLRRGADIPALAQELRCQRVPFALATVVRAVRPTSGRRGYQAIVREDGTHMGWVGGACTEHLLVSEARAAMAAGTPRLLRVAPDPGGFPEEDGVVNRAMTCQSGGTVEIFIEPNLPRPNLLIVGDSPIATSLAALGPMLGFRVVMVAPGVAASELPAVDLLLPGLDPLGAHLGPDTYAVVATMGKYDEAALGPMVKAPLAFLGLVASRKRARAVFATLREDGATPAEIGRVRNPVGIDIAAFTPEEIALSILSEITKVRRTTGTPPTGSGGPTPLPTGTATDPVCRMEVERTSPLRAPHAGTTYYFCSEPCRRKFVKSPAKFLA